MDSVGPSKNPRAKHAVEFLTGAISTLAVFCIVSMILCSAVVPHVMLLFLGLMAVCIFLRTLIVLYYLANFSLGQLMLAVFWIGLWIAVAVGIEDFRVPALGMIVMSLLCGWIYTLDKEPE